MLSNFEIEAGRRTAIYVRISTNQQKTDRQVVELIDFAERSRIEVKPEDIFIDIISGFKDGEIRPKYSELKNLVEEGVYQQILFSEFSRLDRKPSNLLKSIEYYQGKGVYLYFKKQNIWIKDKADISTQIMISVLAVMSQYEIELFVARGIDGKISALKNKGGICGGNTAYGYRVSPADKRLVIDEKRLQLSAGYSIISTKANLHYKLPIFLIPKVLQHHMQQEFPLQSARESQRDFLKSSMPLLILAVSFGGHQQ